MKAQQTKDDDATTSWILTATNLIDALCQRVEILEAKQHASDNGSFFHQNETARELDELRRVVVAQPVRTWLTVDEAAKLCGYSVDAVRAWCRLHPIGTKHKRAYQINRESLRLFLIDRFGEDRLPSALRVTEPQG